MPPPPDLSRYHRQMLLPGFGEEGQKKLLDSSALVVGCGALGTVIANMLARAGVGHLVIADRDVIETTNLQRQILFDEKDVADDLPKAEAAKRKIAQINSQVEVTAVVDDVNHANIEKLINLGKHGRVDVIVDGVDNFETRYVVNDAAVKLGIPYVYGGAVGTVGAAYAILPHTPGNDAPWETLPTGSMATPCLRCIFEEAPPPGLNPTCDTAGVLGPVVSLVSNFQSVEALKILTGNWSRICPTMLNIDVWENTVRQFKVRRAYDVGECVCCKGRRFEFLDGKFGSSTTVICGRNTVQIDQKVAAGRLNFDEIAERLRPHGRVTVKPFILKAEIRDNGDPYELTFYPNGRVMVTGTKEPTTARSIYAKYVGA